MEVHNIVCKCPSAMYSLLLITEEVSMIIFLRFFKTAETYACFHCNFKYKKAFINMSSETSAVSENIIWQHKKH